MLTDLPSRGRPSGCPTRGHSVTASLNCASTLSASPKRIPYFFAGQRRIILLTEFHKQRMNERAEVERARAAMTRCLAEGHTADEEDE